ncbi:MAG: DUF368 domain-containing protein [Spirochaetes bacterium]|nr:DUF368 domain-containing protein [Spirochaetota bacterium]
MIKDIRNFLNGLAFGVTQIIPGVSGGTIAIILGFYFELIETINHFFKDVRKNLRYIIPLLIGTLTGIVIFSSIVNFLLANYSFPTMLFFIGLIAGVIPHIFSKVRENGQKFMPADILLIVIPFVILVVISFLNAESAVDPAEIIANINVTFMIFIFAAGVVSAAALIIPGISGAFVLLLFGIYPLATYSVDSIRLLLTDFSNIALMMDICKVLVPLGLGMILGVLFMARLIEKLLKKYYRQVYLMMLGLLAGSVFALANHPMVYRSGISIAIILIGVTTFVLGCAASFYLGKKRL